MKLKKFYTLEELSKMTGKSKKTIERKFKEATKEKPHKKGWRNTEKKTLSVSQRFPKRVTTCVCEHPD